MQNEPALNDKIENDLPLRFAGFGASVQDAPTVFY